MKYSRKARAHFLFLLKKSYNRQFRQYHTHWKVVFHAGESPMPAIPFLLNECVGQMKIFKKIYSSRENSYNDFLRGNRVEFVVLYHFPQISLVKDRCTEKINKCTFLYKCTVEYKCTLIDKYAAIDNATEKSQEKPARCTISDKCTLIEICTIMDKCTLKSTKYRYRQTCLNRNVFCNSVWRSRINIVAILAFYVVMKKSKTSTGTSCRTEGHNITDTFPQLLEETVEDAVSMIPTEIVSHFRRNL